MDLQNADRHSNAHAATRTVNKNVVLSSSKHKVMQDRVLSETHCDRNLNVLSLMVSDKYSDIPHDVDDKGTSSIDSQPDTQAVVKDSKHSSPRADETSLIITDEGRSSHQLACQPLSKNDVDVLDVSQNNKEEVLSETKTIVPIHLETRTAKSDQGKL